MGYFMGIIHKFMYNYDFIVWLYAINGLMVMIDIRIFFRNVKLDELASSPDAEVV